MTPDPSADADATQPDGDDAVSIERDDPRPVFDGQWATASNEERARHMTRVRVWKQRQSTLVDDEAAHDAAEARDRMAASSGQPAASIRPDDATRSTLIGIRDDANAHDSDRIRAAQALIALDRDAATATGEGPSALVALRDTLALLEPHERLAWLQGERIAHVQAG